PKLCLKIDHKRRDDGKSCYKKEIPFKLLVLKYLSEPPFKVIISQNKVRPSHKHEENDYILDQGIIIPHRHTLIFGRKPTCSHGAHGVVDGIEPSHSGYFQQTCLRHRQSHINKPETFCNISDPGL